MAKFELNHDKKVLKIKQSVFEGADSELMRKINNYQAIGYRVDIIGASKKESIKLEDMKKEMANDAQALEKLNALGNYFAKLKFYKEWKKEPKSKK